MTLAEFKEQSSDFKTLRANVPIVPGIMLLESLVKSAYLAGLEQGDRSIYPDAMRYRWMRENISDDMQWYLLGTHGIGSAGLDEAIDTAILKAELKDKK